MPALYHPHDLVWMDSQAILHSDTPLPDWAVKQWRPDLPLVVRRARSPADQLPTGIRGADRQQRCAIWVAQEHIRRTLTPEQLAQQQTWYRHPHRQHLPALQALSLLHAPLQALGMVWGIGGSTAYELATGLYILKTSSDLDLLLRCPVAPDRQALYTLAEYRHTLPCRLDIQLETPAGGVALLDYLQAERVLVRTDSGPLLLDNPWASSPARLPRHGSAA